VKFKVVFTSRCDSIGDVQVAGQGPLRRSKFFCLAVFNPLKSQWLLYTTYFNILKLCILLTECIHMFLVVLTVNSDYSPKQPIDLYSGDVTCFLKGKR
jgi:hypothetical protein